ncbi:MAG: hypothetical protein ACD_39C01809G0002 [uncultured bacterium]|nr:MAG: hypothetical protein ACD_39C01809G0002 [uncultured bacterium]
MDYNKDENNHEELDQQPPKYDPAGETKHKALFFVIAIIVLIAAKFILGF